MSDPKHKKKKGLKITDSKLDKLIAGFRTRGFHSLIEPDEMESVSRFVELSQAMVYPIGDQNIKVWPEVGTKAYNQMVEHDMSTPRTIH